jgi:hypothetical protein
VLSNVFLERVKGIGPSTRSLGIFCTNREMAILLDFSDESAATHIKNDLLIRTIPRHALSDGFGSSSHVIGMMLGICSG